MYVNESKKFVFVKHNNRCQVLYRTRLFNLQDSVTDYYDKIMKSFEICVKSNINKNKFSPTAFIVWKNICSDRISDKAVWLNCSMTCSIWHVKILSHWNDDVLQNCCQSKSVKTTHEHGENLPKERKKKETNKETNKIRKKRMKERKEERKKENTQINRQANE